jgi:phage tail-like protein
MPPAGRPDPFPGYQFVVEIDGIASAGFSDVSGIEGTIDVVEYREGADRSLASQKLPGLVRYANVVLTRGLTSSNDLYDWWKAVAAGTPDRRSVAIVLLDRERTAVRRWTLRDAWPVRYAVSPLDAGRGAVAIETLELAHEGFEAE